MVAPEPPVPQRAPERVGLVETVSRVQLQELHFTMLVVAVVRQPVLLFWYLVGSGAEVMATEQDLGIVQLIMVVEEVRVDTLHPHGMEATASKA